MQAASCNCCCRFACDSWNAASASSAARVIACCNLARWTLRSMVTAGSTADSVKCKPQVGGLRALAVYGRSAELLPYNCRNHLNLAPSSCWAAPSPVKGLMCRVPTQISTEQMFGQVANLICVARTPSPPHNNPVCNIPPPPGKHSGGVWERGGLEMRTWRLHTSTRRSKYMIPGSSACRKFPCAPNGHAPCPGTTQTSAKR